MASTDARLAAAVLDALTIAGMDFAFLHREQDAADGLLADDYDLVVQAGDTSEVLRRADAAWLGTGLQPVIASEYDAGSVAVWMVTPDAGEGVQMDFLYDRHTVNQFDLDVSGWLDSAIDGARWRQVLLEHEAAYRERKRALKAGLWRPALRWSRSRAEIQRLGRRLSSRAGFWVHVTGDSRREDLQALVDRFARFLPTARVLPGDLHGWRSVRFQRLLPILLLKPALIVTSSSVHLPFGPDLRLDSTKSRDHDACAALVTEQMTRRFRSRLGNTWTGASGTMPPVGGARIDRGTPRDLLGGTTGAG